MKKAALLFLIFHSYLYSQIELTATESSNIGGYSTASEGDLYLDTNNNYYIGLQNGSLLALSASSNWLLSGNSNISSNSFLGTTNDVKMRIGSNNTSILEFGKRGTLGLTQSYPDYNDADQYLTYLKGSNGLSTLQFQADGASFYKPMFYTTSNGSFRLKGSTGKTDFFELGSGGPNNNGKLEFIIGDDGNEPILFKRYDYRNGKFYKEFFRVQGHNTSSGAKTRFGININPDQKPLDPTNNENPNSGYNIANSTLELNGSISLSILRTTGNLTLNEDHHTIIVTGNHSITLPSASSCKGRVYVIKNTSGYNPSITSYRAYNSTSLSYLQTYRVIQIQSDGTEWQQINNY